MAEKSGSQPGKSGAIAYECRAAQLALDELIRLGKTFYLLATGTTSITY